MSDQPFRILDEEAVKDPATLLDALSYVIERQRLMSAATAMTVALMLDHLGRYTAPPERREYVIGLLAEFLDNAEADMRRGALADQIQEFLEAKE